MTHPALLLLVDGRFPTGGHGHSGGMEEAVADGRVVDLDTLVGFLRGRLWTVGRCDAALSAAACSEAALDTPAWALLDAEAAARCPSAELRRSGRSLGRGLLRVAATAWPGPWASQLRAAVPDGPFVSVALGAAAAAAGVEPHGAALAAAHGAAAAPAWAAVRLLGLDPLAVAAALAGLAPDIDAVARLVANVGSDWSALPALSAPLLDIGAERHHAWEVRLFAS